MKLTVNYKGKQKVVGVIEDGVFKKSVNKEKHLFRKYNAWGIDYNVLVNSIIPNCHTIQIYETQEGIYYSCPVSYYGELDGAKFKPNDKAMVRQFDRTTNGVQIFLPLRHFIKETNQGKLFS